MGKKRSSTAANKSKSSSTNRTSARARTSNKQKTTNAAAAATTTTSSLSRLLDASSSSNSSTTNNKVETETLVPDHVFVARSFMSRQECLALIQMAEGKNDTCNSNEHGRRESSLEYVSHPATRDIAQRTCHRWQKNDKLFAKSLFDRIVTTTNILHQFDSQFPTHYVPIGCNSNIRLYKYEKGMAFGQHYDGSQRTDGGEGGCTTGTTEITVLIYLSNDDDLVGGATRFYPTFSRKKRHQSVAFDPQQGALLLHIHGDRCLLHEADAVVSGVKYVLRTDIVYSYSGA